jgi:hypothetical protein
MRYGRMTVNDISRGMYKELVMVSSIFLEEVRKTTVTL